MVMKLQLCLRQWQWRDDYRQDDGYNIIKIWKWKILNIATVVDLIWWRDFYCDDDDDVNSAVMIAKYCLIPPYLWLYKIYNLSNDQRVGTLTIQTVLKKRSPFNTQLNTRYGIHPLDILTWAFWYTKTYTTATVLMRAHVHCYCTVMSIVVHQ